MAHFPLIDSKGTIGMNGLVPQDHVWIRLLAASHREFLRAESILDYRITIPSTVTPDCPFCAAMIEWSESFERSFKWILDGTEYDRKHINKFYPFWSGRVFHGYSHHCFMGHCYQLEFSKYPFDGEIASQVEMDALVQMTEKLMI